MPADLMIRVTDASGRSLSFGYDSTNRLVKILDPENQTYKYRYDTNSNLSSVTYPGNTTKTYLYNEVGYTSGADLTTSITGIIDENNVRYASYWYDTTGRANKEELAPGLGLGIDQHSLTYNTGNTIVTDPLGTARTYNFTTILGAVKSTGTNQPGGSGCGPAASNLTYDANGNIKTRTDFNGNTTWFDYDMSRNLETVRIEAYATPLARTINTAWHPNFRLPTVITEPGRMTAMSYDPVSGNVLTKTITSTSDAKVRQWTYTYTTAGDGALPNLLKTIDGPRTDVSDVTSYAYYPNGDLKAITNALGHVTQITLYDAHGKPLSIVDPNNLNTTLTYWPRGWIKSRSVGAETTTYDYDGVGQIKQVNFPSGAQIRYDYDDAHRLTDIWDAQGNRIHYTLDNIGNRVKEEIFDSAGQLAQTKSRVFDALNRLWKDIGAFNQTTTYAYDANGNLTQIDGPLTNQNDITTHSYDALNRVASSTDGLMGVTRYGYDTLDQLRSVTDPRTLVTQYNVNALGDQTQLVSPDTGATTNTYDAAGNLKTRTDARGAQGVYTYDALNRVTRLAYPDKVFDFQYDQGPNALGRLTQMTDGVSLTTWRYDTQGRVAGKEQTAYGTKLGLAYGYDAAGRLNRLTLPSGQILTYAYDPQGRIAGLSLGAAPLLSNIQYQAFGPAKRWTWGNGTPHARSYDADGRINGYPLAANARTLSFDAAARITGLTDTQPAANQLFDYDPLDRLTGWIAPQTNQSYAYDANGNRSRLTIGANQYAYAYPAAGNKLASVAGPQAKSYSYDAAGNLTGDGAYAYTYDGRGRLSQAMDLVNWRSVNYLVNGLGQRVAKSGWLEITDFNFYVYDEAGHLVGEYDAYGAPIAETVYLGEAPVAVIKGGQVHYVYADHLNTPRVITDQTNKTVWRWDSNPFGADAANEDADGDGVKFGYNLRFPGQYWDKETGLHQNYFRDYDSSTGRYVQSDPIGLEGGLNTYTYVENNPISFVDPEGLAGGPPAPGTYYPRGTMPKPPLNKNEANSAAIEAGSEVLNGVTKSSKPNVAKTQQLVCRRTVCTNPNYSPNPKQCTPGNPRGTPTDPFLKGPFVTTPSGQGIANCICEEWGWEFR
ncbi:MAG: RHS repeat protein [Burkholderiales bacterium]|nr:RHS repeat protein [Burkholderiales bacterium]